MDKQIINHKLKNLLDGLAKLKGFNKQQVAEFILKEGGEVDERNDCILQIRKAIKQSPIDIDALTKVIMNSFITGGHGSVRAQSKTFLKDKELPSRLESLFSSQGVKAEQIESFLDYAVAAGFHDSKGRPRRSVAAAILSVLLAAAFPGQFVDFVNTFWKYSAKVLGAQYPQGGTRYAELLRWAGDFAITISETETFKTYFKSNKKEHTTIVAGLVYLIKNYTEFQEIISGKQSVSATTVIPKEDYLKVLRELDAAGTLKPNHKKILAINYVKPLTTRMIAERMGYSNYSGVNSCYGNLGKLFCNKLDKDYKYKVEILVSFSNNANNETIFTMRDNLKAALDEFDLQAWRNIELTPQEEQEMSGHKPQNIIIYGPPGTGKTYELQQEWFKKYTSEHATQTKEEFNIELVSNLAWWEVITAVMLDLKEAKVPNVFEHPLLQAKISISQNQSPKSTIWSWLQRHTKLDCENVNFTKRDEPLLFTKDSKGIWSIDTELASNEVPELVKLLESYKHYKPEVKKEKRYSFVTFHQAFGYEEFVEGIRPVVDEENEAGEISYRVEPGIFRQICKRAQDDQNNKYAIFIDEINRGNIAKILGELITLIEPDKRLGQDNELTVKLPYSKDIFGVPANLDIIGTMNTADRSIAQIDTALRRRFEFKELMPKTEVILGSDDSGNIDEGINIQKFLKAINERIEFLLNRDHMIGHSYFIRVKSFEQFVAVLRNKVIPLLQEYFYEDWHRIQLVFKDVIDPDGNAHDYQVIRHKVINEEALLGFDHDDYEDDKLYWVNETITPEAIRKVYQK